MKAAVFYGSGERLRIEEVPTPEINDSEVLIRVVACGLCHSDLHYLDHNVPTFKKPPLILGHEPAGIVTAVGRQVTSIAEGTRVLLPPVIGCGVCYSCRTGRQNNCPRAKMFGNDMDGAFAEYVKAPAHEVFVLPDEIPMEEGCIISDAVTTPYHAVRNRAKVRPGEVLVVYGCGGLGINTIQAAVLAGAIVIAVDIADSKLTWARKMGAAETINSQAVEDVAKTIRKLTGGGADVAIEAIGKPVTIEQAFNSLRVGGRLVTMGYCDRPVTFNVSRIMYREMEVIGSLGCPPAEYPRVIELVRQGRLQVVPLVTGKFPLDSINEGFDVLRSGEGLRSVVVM